jgi:Zn-dependent peptidase ImmA (M78 family)
MQALLYRAKGLRVMNDNVYRRAVTELNARGWRTQEPLDDGIAEEPILLRRALDLASESISLESVASEARLPPRTIEAIANLDERPEVLVVEEAEH